MIKNGPKISVRIKRGWRKTVASSLRRNVVERTTKREMLPIFTIPMLFNQPDKRFVIRRKNALHRIDRLVAVAEIFNQIRCCGGGIVHEQLKFIIGGIENLSLQI